MNFSSFNILQHMLGSNYSNWPPSVRMTGMNKLRSLAGEYPAFTLLVASLWYSKCLLVLLSLHCKISYEQGNVYCQWSCWRSHQPIWHLWL